MAPSKTVDAVQEEDLNEIIDQIVASKHNLTISMVLVKNFPDTEGRRRSTEPSVKGAYSNPSCTSLKVVDDKTGELLGYLVFEKKHAQKVTPEAKSDAAHDDEQSNPNSALAAFNLDVLNMLMEGANKISGYMAGRDHFEIVFIVVKKDYRRQGIGRLLMQAAMEKSKEEGIPLAAHAEPASYQFFKSLGFKDTVSVDFDLAQFAPPHSGFGTFRFQGIIKE